jgi:hypothetical protein
MSSFPLRAQEQSPPTAIDIYSMARTADFIFKGKAIDIQYRNSQSVQVTDPSGKPVYEDGLPVLVDGSNLPYTFVTYAIERIYKGKAPVGSPLYLTLRIVGGVDAQKPGEIVEVPHYPHMDMDDRDILFVRRNTLKECPLVQSEKGRFRAIRPPGTTTTRIFNDMGHQVLRVVNPSPGRDEVDLGAYQHLPEVTTHFFGNCDDCKIETSVEQPPNEFSLPGQDGGSPEPGQPRGAQFTESQFDVFVDYVVAQMHTPSELQNLPPVVSADIGKPFYGPVCPDDTPKSSPPETPMTLPRPWLDQLPAARRNSILEAERQEEQWFVVNGGDPVLPSTPCEIRLLTDGAIPGDISGPLGRPDCYVDLHDLAAIAQSWLECSDPANTLCSL